VASSGTVSPASTRATTFVLNRRTSTTTTSEAASVEARDAPLEAHLVAGLVERVVTPPG
jgi:hypothetical protein